MNPCRCRSPVSRPNFVRVVVIGRARPKFAERLVPIPISLQSPATCGLFRLGAVALRSSVAHNSSLLNSATPLPQSAVNRNMQQLAEMETGKTGQMVTTLSVWPAERVEKRVSKS